MNGCGRRFHDDGQDKRGLFRFGVLRLVTAAAVCACLSRAPADPAADSRPASAPASTPASAPAGAEIVHSSRTQEEVRTATAAMDEKTKALKFQATKAEFTAADGYRMNYRLAAPKPQVPGRKYPLVILFGGNLTGANPLVLPEYQAKHPCYVAEMVPAVPSQDLGRDKGWKQKVARTTQALVGDLLTRHDIDRDRIYATGHSAAGGMVWATALTCPDLLAAIAPSAATCEISLAPALVEHRVAAWVFMGAKDNAVGIDNPRGARAMVEAIVQAGGSVRYTEYDNLGHSYACMTEPDLPALLDWMFAQRRPPARK